MKRDERRRQTIGLLFVLAGAGILLLLSHLFVDPAKAIDLRVLYYPARSLIRHVDPYNETKVQAIYRSEGADHPPYTAAQRLTATRYIYMPTTFAATVPLAMLPWDTASAIWQVATFLGLVIAGILAWNLSANLAPIFSGCMVGFVLANCERLLIGTNAAGIAVSLCVIGVWCFLKCRFALLGVCCIAISLILKPQDAGLVWLYLLLAGETLRRRAIDILMVAVALSLPAVIWVWSVSPHWIAELHHNMLAFSANGGLMDPSPAATYLSGPGTMMTNLQISTSYFTNNPDIYNAAAYFIGGGSILLWALTAIRSKSSQYRHVLALSTIIPLSMLPVYHRQYDAKLILLAIPAAALLWSESTGTIRWLGLALNAASILAVSDFSWTILRAFLPFNLSLASNHQGSLLLTEVFALPLSLLALGIFNLSIYSKAEVTTRTLTKRPI